MMSSRRDPQAPTTVTDLLAAIDEENLRVRIDVPINNAVATFQIASEHMPGRAPFLQAVGAFVKHVYEHGVLFSQRLSEEQAQAEAVQILESAYQSATAKGYLAAFLDSQNPMYDGLSVVLDALAETIRQRERWKFVSWTLHASVDPLDWDAQVRATEEIISIMQPYLPGTFDHYAPALLAGDWDALVHLHRDTDRLLDDVVRSQGLHSGF